MKVKAVCGCRLQQAAQQACMKAGIHQPPTPSSQDLYTCLCAPTSQGCMKLVEDADKMDAQTPMYVTAD